MTKSNSPRARRVDWAAVAALHARIDTQQSTNELVPAWQRNEIVEPRWAPEYVAALETALDGADTGELISLLDSRRLIHPLLLPLLAELLRRQAQGVSVGAPKKLTHDQEDGIRWMFDIARPKSVGEFDGRMAKFFNVSERLIANVRRRRS
jgi:hypothetical protein